MLHKNDIAARAAERPPTLEEVHVNGVAVRVLESCHSLWIFEPARGFCLSENKSIDYFVTAKRTGEIDADAQG